MMRRLFLFSFLFVFLAGGFVLGQVQTTTAIQGTVSDPTGAVLPGVDVTIVNQETGVSRSAVTNDVGYFNFRSLRPGVFTIQASLPGFKTSTITDQEVLVAIPAQVNITMQLGEISEQVTVSAAGAELVNKTTAELATTIDEDLVRSLPNETRNYFDLLALAPNTSPQYLSNGNMSFGQHALRRVNAANSQESSGVFAAGNRDSASNVSIDGANQQLAVYNNTVNIQSSSTVKELRLQTASANAEFGNGSNAVNVITKGGTNDFHGEVFWQHRNDNLDANGFFVNLAGSTVPEYKRNKFGASLGGPIVSDKLFFFGNYEGSRLREARPQTTTVATAAMKQGDLSDVRLSAPGGGLQPVPTIYNPFDFDPETGLRTPFPDNRIPSDLLDPGMQVLLASTPDPNGEIDGVPRLIGNRPFNIDENQTTARIDWEQAEDSTIWGRFSFAEREALRGDIMPFAGEDTPSSTWTGVVNWSKVFSPVLINDLSVSYVRTKWGIGRPTDVPDLSTAMGLKNVSSIPGAPSMSVENYAVAGSGSFVWDPTQNSYQIKDDFSWTRGTHALKFGVHFTERRLYFIKTSNDKGRLEFRNTYAAACPLGNSVCEDALAASGLDAGGLAFADLLLGTISPRSLLIRRPVTWHGFQGYWGIYGQDTWQVSRNLTLNFGLRWEYWPAWGVPRNATMRFDYNPPGGLVFALEDPLDVFDPATDFGRDAPLKPGLPRQGYETGLNNFAPRLGFAYSITPDTVLRAAAGIFYAGNINTNQLSDIQAGGDPFVTRVEQFVGRDEQLPPLNVSEQFSPPSTAIPLPFDDPVATPRALGQLRYETPAVYQWSLSFQHRFTEFWSAHFDYLGSHTIKNSQFVDMNAADLPTGDDRTLQERRRLPGWGRWGSWVPWGYGKYHSATWGLRNRQWKGLSFMANFQWAKNITTSYSVIASDQGNLHYAFYDLWRGRSNFFPKFRFISGWSYDLPWGVGRANPLSGAADAVLGGWIISGITEFSQGPPQEVRTSDNTGSALSIQTADRLPNCDVNDATGDRFEYFNTACFAQPEFGTFGTANFGILTAPGINNWRMTLAKSFNLMEDHKLEFRLEAFNAFNVTQWGNMQSSFNSSSFGRITGNRPARQLQVALFYVF